jgi:hypothetical protein
MEGASFNCTSAARHPSFDFGVKSEAQTLHKIEEGHGFATQDHSWCAFIGAFKRTANFAASLICRACLVNNYEFFSSCP